MKQSDLDVIGDVMRAALARHERGMEAMLAERTAQYLDATRMRAEIHERLGAAEDRFLELLKSSGELAEVAQRAAAVEVIALREKCQAQEDQARELGEQVCGLRDQLTGALEDHTHRQAERIEQERSQLDTDLRAFVVEQLLQRDERIVELGAQLSELREALADMHVQMAEQVRQAREHAEGLLTSDEARERFRGEPGQSIKGDPGESIKGEPGEAGAGIEAPAWAPGIYREGAIVQAYLGQYYRALTDTADEPYGSASWQRVGTAGFHFAEPYAEGRTYELGDLFMRDFGTFAWTAAGAQLVAGRGAKGDPGKKGDPGEVRHGKDGKDGAHIEHLEFSGQNLVLVLRHADGTTQALEANFVAPLEALAEAIQENVLRSLAPPSTPMQ